MHNPGHSITYKYKGTTQYKIQHNLKIQDKIYSRPDEAGKPKTRREHLPRSLENTVNLEVSKHVHTRASNTNITTRRERVSRERVFQERERG